VAGVALVAFASGCSSGARGEADGGRSASELAADSEGGAPSTLPLDPSWPFELSPDSIVFGADTDGAPLYACRASYLGSIQVGKTRADWSFCDFGHGGVERVSTDYQTLAAPWYWASAGAIPAAARDFGNGAGPDPSVYACRAFISNSTQVGKIRAGFPGCDVTFGGQEHFVATYEVLEASPFPILEVETTSTPVSAEISGGTDVGGATLYPCFVRYAGSVEPGKTRADWSACVIGFGGQEIFVGAPYFVLTPEMSRTTQFNFPYQAGTDPDGRPLGVCASPFNASTQVGKLLGPYAGCSFGYGGKEVFATDTGQFLWLGYTTIP
jgi:hypothetical protein